MTAKNLENGLCNLLHLLKEFSSYNVISIIKVTDLTRCFSNNMREGQGIATVRKYNFPEAQEGDIWIKQWQNKHRIWNHWRTKKEKLQQ